MCPSVLRSHRSFLMIFIIDIPYLDLVEHRPSFFVLAHLFLLLPSVPSWVSFFCFGTIFLSVSRSSRGHERSRSDACDVYQFITSTLVLVNFNSNSIPPSKVVVEMELLLKLKGLKSCVSLSTPSSWTSVRTFDNCI